MADRSTAGVAPDTPEALVADAEALLERFGRADAGRLPARRAHPGPQPRFLGIVRVVRGTDRYRRWQLEELGGSPRRARLPLAEELTLRAGDVLWFDEPPDDIHSQRGVGGPAWELVYFGRNPNLIPRADFDPETSAVTFDDAVR